MGVCGSSPVAYEQRSVLTNMKARNKSIDRIIKVDEKKRGREVKLLLLGGGSSGKSTVLKAMRLLHNVPFTHAELLEYRALLYRNLIESLQQLLELVEELHLDLHPSNFSNASAIYHILIPQDRTTYLHLFPPEIKARAVALWADPGMQEGWSHAKQAAIPENLPYLMANIDRFFKDGFLPSETDILRTRARTTGILEAWFQIRDWRYLLVDVGGQRSERRKWLHCFSNVSAIVFVHNLAGYDECLVEDRGANQARDSLLLFSTLLANPIFKHTPFILFLNKLDLLTTKVRAMTPPSARGAQAKPSNPIRPYFADYPRENEGDVGKAREFFKSQFLRLGRKRTREVGRNTGSGSGEKGGKGVEKGGEKGGEKGAVGQGVLGKVDGGVYVHWTTAVDKNNMSAVMLAVTDLMVRQMIKDMALM